MSTPCFAILGHPNEGKSSVVSTLTENERVRVSRTPGETTRCHRYEVKAGPDTVLEMIDTPGFQNPGATLAWFEQFQGEEKDLVASFIEAHRDQPAFHHDLELLEPLTHRAAILYVADTSRPLRQADRREMEILRLTGLPRMALLNRKKDASDYEEAWREALNRRFNLVRNFNAHHASFAERMDLLSALAILVPEHETSLQTIRDRLIRDWQERLHQSARVLEDMLHQTLTLEIRVPVHPDQDEAAQRSAAIETYRARIRQIEANARKAWRDLFHHQALPPLGEDQELMDLDPFTEKVWRLLGLSRRQITAATASAAAMLGVGIDAAAGGITFGIFTAGGALLGGIGGWIGGPRLGRKTLPFPGRTSLAHEQIQVGPHRDPSLAFVLTDRALMYLTRLMNWAHARRDYASFQTALPTGTERSRKWTAPERKQLTRWVTAFFKDGPSVEQTQAVHDLLLDRLQAGSATREPSP